MTFRGMTLTVEELNEYVRRTLAGDPMLRGICLRGEISNFKRHISGHWYFTLKDPQSAIQCAMFRQAAVGVAFSPKDGQQIKLFGSVGLYAKTGQYQFYAEAMEPDGVGEMYALFEERKQRLTKEGLFDASLKKPIPLLSKGIGIVTSKTGAVVHDIARVAWRRNSGMPLYLCPVSVQGQGAAAEIAGGIALLDSLPEIDVIIVGRGGGSMEDLWAFNEEVVARAIYACKTPIISAVGHETDFTIADFAADLRAATPSAAAEMAVQSRENLTAMILSLTNRLGRACELSISAKQEKWFAAEKLLREMNPERQGQAMLARIRECRQRMESSFEQLLREKENAVSQCKLRLNSAGPEATLSRGYAIVMKDGSPVRSIRDISQGAAIRVLVPDGAAMANVTSIEKGELLWQQKGARQ